ncbi:DgyrCDS5495 [Dimorphilus gyrociliatus]|uniref:DgyrCDS5495 n=1 Tax=Dimorphilus gyrociliatus TaxID=2664684 RepID=A0A7I8VMC7_9ANNE|nr:DgyrCDS5495 [Dimorphilus gyrociliatus]
MNFIERREEPTKALAKFLKAKDIRLVYITGPMGIGKKTYGTRLRDRLKKLINPCLTSEGDFRHYCFKQPSEAPDLEVIFKSLLISCCNTHNMQHLSLEEILKDNDLKNQNIVLSIYHLEKLLGESLKFLELIKTGTNMILDALPKCYIIFTSDIQCNIFDEKQKSICLKRFMKHESVEFLKNYVKNHEELAQYGDRMAKICDYLPITLSLAGAVWSAIDSQFYKDVQEFINYLEDPEIYLKILSTKDFVLDDRIQLKIKRSLENLNEESLADLIAITYIPGTFNDEAISAILGKRVQEIKILKEKHLVVTESNERYDVLKSVRDYINTVIGNDYPSENKLVLHFRYVRFFGDILEQFQSKADSKDCGKALLPIDQEYTNLQKFLQEAIHANNSYQPYINAAINAESLIVSFLQKDSLEFYENLLKASEQLGSLKEQGQIFSALSNIYSSSFYDYKRGKQYAIIGLERLEKSAESTQLELGMIKNRLGFAKFKQGEVKDGIKYLEMADKIFDSEGRKQFHSFKIMMKHSSVLANRGITAILAGDYEKAYELHRRVLHMRKPILGKNHGDVALQYNSFGLIARERNKYQEALRNFSISLRIKRKLYPKGNTAVLIGYYNIIDIFVKLDKFDEVEKLFKQAVECFKMLGEGGNKTLIGAIYTAYASSFVKRQQYSKACEMFQISYEIREKYSKSPAFQFHTLVGYVNALRLSRNYELAMEIGRKGKSAINELMKQRPEHTLIPTLYKEIFLVYKGVENIKKCKKYLRIYVKHVDGLMHTDIRHKEQASKHSSLIELIDCLKDLDDDLKSLFYEMNDIIDCSICSFNLKEHIRSLNIL